MFQRLKKKIKLSTTTSLIKYIAEEAMKEKMGARPIKRLIQKNIENQLSKLILGKSLPEGASVKFFYIKSQVKYEIKELEA